MEKSREEEFRNFEEEVFKALDNQGRRDILRYVGEGGNPALALFIWRPLSLRCCL